MKTKRKEIIDTFHRLYYDRGTETWRDTFYFGIQTYKLPLDMWAYQEIIVRTRPDVIIECGTYKGGSALYLAHLCDALGHGRVITIDDLSYGQRVSRVALAHPRIRFIKGSSTGEATLRAVRTLACSARTRMVILDSDHTKAHVRRELAAYAPLVTKGSYLIVEDTNINGHPVRNNFGPGPMEALRSFLRKNPAFVSDTSYEKFLFTFNPKGYLRRVR